MNRLTSLWFVLALHCACFSQAIASQISIGGSAFEEKLTREPISARAKVAAKLGALIKAPVHEEITQLAFDCPVGASLLDDRDCASVDSPFASAFVIAGVRWNDLPPFRLSLGQASTCKKITLMPACNTNETVRFSTQPECWYCLFTNAAKTAKEKQIAGCNAKPGQARGNLMTRSHFGDLQFLHSMANADDAAPATTQKKILGWMEFAWRVATNEFKSDTQLNAIKIESIQEHFGCTGWTVGDLYVLGRNDTKLLKHVDEIAFGSVLHTVQDSFSAAHVARTAPAPTETCSGLSTVVQPGLIEEFHSYGKQDSHKHDVEDEREAMVSLRIGEADMPIAVVVSRQMVDYFRARKKWEEVAPYFLCVFELSPTARSSSPGKYASD